MRFALIVFARTNSKRLPGKSLKKIGRISLINHILLRAQKIKNKDLLIFATSNNKSDNNLAKSIYKKNIKLFRGSLDNVVLRTLKCCEHYKVNAFVRICGDRPFFSVKEIEYAIKKFKKRKKMPDIASNLLGSKISPGKTIEIISYKALKGSYKKIKNKYDLEHLTSFFYKNKKYYNLMKIKVPNYNNPKFRYTVDNKNDLMRTKFILSKNEKKRKDLTDYQIYKYTKQWFENEKKF